MVAKKSSVNWEEVKAAYVEGIEKEGKRQYPTLDALAATYATNASSLRRKASREKWIDERNIYVTKLQQARSEHRIEVLASKGAMFDAQSLRIADALASQIQVHLAKSAKANVELAPGTLNTLSQAMQKVQAIGRLALGDTTDNTGVVNKPANVMDLDALTTEELKEAERIVRKACEKAAQRD